MSSELKDYKKFVFIKRIRFISLCVTRKTDEEKKFKPSLGKFDTYRDKNKLE